MLAASGTQIQNKYLYHVLFTTSQPCITSGSLLGTPCITTALLLGTPCITSVHYQSRPVSGPVSCPVTTDRMMLDASTQIQNTSLRALSASYYQSRPLARSFYPRSHPVNVSPVN